MEKKNIVHTNDEIFLASNNSLEKYLEDFDKRMAAEAEELGADYEKIEQGDKLTIKNIYAGMESGKMMLLDETKGIEIPYETTYLEGELMDAYLHDLAIVQEFASLNREIILAEITKHMKWKILDSYSCIHNYVDFRLDTPILRKGAISAQKDEPVIIPINMRDGILLGTGLGNADWNYSAPHGAGRIMKRKDVKANYTVSNFKSAMKGIYSSCINKETLDEAPFAYRDLDSIQDAIQETVAIEKVIKPIYNFKAGN